MKKVGAKGTWALGITPEGFAVRVPPSIRFEVAVDRGHGMECSISRRQCFVRLFGAATLVAVACCALPIAPNDLKFVPWLLVAGGGSWAVIHLINLFRAGPQVTLNDVGILDHRSGLTISWADICSLSLLSQQGNKTVTLAGPHLRVEVVSAARYVGKLRQRGRVAWLDDTHLLVNFSLLTPSLDEVWEYLKATSSNLISEERRHPALPLAAQGATRRLSSYWSRHKLAWTLFVLVGPVLFLAGVLLSPGGPIFPLRPLSPLIYLAFGLGSVGAAVTALGMHWVIQSLRE